MINLGSLRIWSPACDASCSGCKKPGTRVVFRFDLGGANAPGFRLHPLKGDRAGHWSVRVSGNWRVVFRFEDGEAVGVDLIDYH